VSDSDRRVKRFYKIAGAQAKNGKFAIMLDGREAKTVTGARLETKRENLADAVGAEWAAQGAYIDRASMPLTALLSISINAGESVDVWTDEIVKFLNSDLICYRAETPAALIERQNEGWDRYLEWARSDLGVDLVKTTGIVSIDQPAASIEAAQAALDGHNAETILAIKTLTEITGSAVIALSLWRAAFSVDDAFAASRLDEHFQIERWGVDDDAAAREAQLKKDFDAAALFMRLTGE